MRSMGTQILLVIQIVIIAVLLARVYVLGLQVDDLSSDSVAVRSYAAGADRADGATRPASFNAEISADAATQLAIRQIIREELAAFAAELPAQEDMQGAAPRVAAAETVRKADPAIERRVSEQMHALIARGQASPADIAALESSIGQLPPDQRRAALAELTRAMNDGRIDGRY